MDLPLLSELWHYIATAWAPRTNGVLLRCTCRALYKAIPAVHLSTEEAYAAGWHVLVLHKSRPDYGFHVRQAMTRLITTKHPIVPVFMEQFPYIFKYIYADERMSEWFTAAIRANYTDIIPILRTHIDCRYRETLEVLMEHDKETLLLVLTDMRRQNPILPLQEPEALESLTWAYGHGPGMVQWFDDWRAGLPLADTMDDCVIEERPLKRARLF